VYRREEIGDARINSGNPEAKAQKDSTCGNFSKRIGDGNRKRARGKDIRGRGKEKGIMIYFNVSLLQLSFVLSLISSHTKGRSTKGGGEAEGRRE